MALSCLILLFCPWLFASRMCLFFHTLFRPETPFVLWNGRYCFTFRFICFVFFSRYSSIHGHKVESSASQILTESRLQMSLRRSLDGPEHHQQTKSPICPGQASTLELPLPRAPSNFFQ
jgi:hypothetical protein